MRIRAHIVLMAAAILLPVITAAGMALQKIREGERDAALRGLHETVRATALIVDREVQGSLSGLKALSLSEHLTTRNFEALYAQATALNQGHDVWTLLLNSEGHQVFNTVVPFGTPPPPPAAKERVAQTLATGKPLITDLIVGPATGKLLTTVYLPVRLADGTSYALAQAFAVDHWKKTALQAQLPSDWIVAVIDRQGKFIARSHKANELLGQPARPELVAAAAAARDGLIQHSTVEGIDAYDAFSHSSLTGWTIAVAAPVRSIEASAQRALGLALGGLGLALAAALAAAALFGRRFIAAIEAARRAAVALGQGHQPEIRPTAIQEVDELNGALVDAGALLDAERRSRHAAEEERERLLQSETAARETAQAQNVAKDQFLAMLGHELRNPLAAISGATSLLEMGGYSKERSERYLEIIRRQNRHLAHIVNDLLDVSRLMAGKIALERQPLDLADCVAKCVEALRATDRAIGYRIEVQAEPVWVEGDAVRIEQILNNLLTNALKFSPVGTLIEVTAGPVESRARVQVRDAGVGIGSDLLPRVFEPFVQGPAPANRTQSGLGIGLALVRQLVALHGGVAAASSEGPGRGAAFTIELPSVPAPRTVAGEEEGGSGEGWRLVYVEDNDDARATLGELLRAFGFEVVEVERGAAVLDAVLQARPDAVVLDIGLPDIDGYEVARRLRAHPDSRFVPLVALTGYGQLRDKEEAALAGFDAHLVKPVEPQALVQTLRAVISGARAALPARG